MQIAAPVRSARRGAALDVARKPSERDMISWFGSWSRSVGATLLVAAYPTRKLIAFTGYKMIPPSDGGGVAGPRLKACVCVTETLRDSARLRARSGPGLKRERYPAE